MAGAKKNDRKYVATKQRMEEKISRLLREMFDGDWGWLLSRIALCGWPSTSCSLVWRRLAGWIAFGKNPARHWLGLRARGLMPCVPGVEQGTPACLIR